jgi:hypothetical protein
MNDQSTLVNQTHCPGCGVHREACKDPTTYTAVDGRPAWKCAECINSKQQEAVEPKTLIPCPACRGNISNCGMCRNLGSVFVATAQIRTISAKNTPGMLTEG